jgi:uncharacterized protein
MTPLREPALHFTLKVASRCNLNCTYCYVYNKSDQTWRTRPKLMSPEVLEAALLRIRQHCLRSGQRQVQLVFHGGEPLLFGPERFDATCRRIREYLSETVQVRLFLQTNGVLLDEEWAEVLGYHEVRVGVSIDGPAHLHDAHRVDHGGRGSYEAIVRGLGVLRAARVSYALLTVIPLGADPITTHRHLMALEPSSMEYLFPDFTHDTITSVREKFGQTPCADFLIPIFDDWWRHGTMDVKVGPFFAMARAILGGQPEVDYVGNPPLRFLFVETGGELEGLDVLRVCEERLSSTGANVLTHEVGDVAQLSPLHRQVVFDGMPLPSGCQQCPEANTCSGGYLPHRYSGERRFNNPSVWCADLLRLFSHIRERMAISHQETRLRARVLAEMAEEASRE